MRAALCAGAHPALSPSPAEAPGRPPPPPPGSGLGAGCAQGPSSGHLGFLSARRLGPHGVAPCSLAWWAVLSGGAAGGGGDAWGAGLPRAPGEAVPASTTPARGNTPVPMRWQGGPLPPPAFPLQPRFEAFSPPQVQQLSRELAAVREAGAQAAESLRSAEAASSELRDKLQRSARELGDLTAVKDARCARSPGPSGRGVGSCGATVGTWARVARRGPVRFLMDAAAFQDQGPGGPAPLRAAHVEEGGGDVPEEVSVPGPGIRGVGSPQQNLALPGAARAGSGAAHTCPGPPAFRLAQWGHGCPLRAFAVLSRASQVLSQAVKSRCDSPRVRGTGVRSDRGQAVAASRRDARAPRPRPAPAVSV